jgi:MoaA/NifB/PqqE/SkfB family radical SAM enzyme
MTVVKELYHTFKRYRTLQTDHISALPIVILMPHSACNCRCIMCDIWKDNNNLKQLTEADVEGLLDTFKKFGTRQVVMSGGEALLNPNFFRFCEILHKHQLKITLLSTGLTLARNADQVCRWVDDVIVSLDGDETTHNSIRNIPHAFDKLKEGIEALKTRKPSLRITSRTVIHRLNFRKWAAIIEAAKALGIDQVSFLPADISSHAFNREVLWSDARQHEILPDESELPALKNVLNNLIEKYGKDIDAGYIAENRTKLEKIYIYYSAFYGHHPFPYKKCNAPWVSTVIEADGTVRPCFFHAPVGNIRKDRLENILNNEASLRFRKELDMDNNSTCIKCVCYLNLSPATRL